MTHLPKVLLFLGLLVACASETASDERVQAPEPPRLVAQRVTATVKREASRLVQIQTEHEALLTTPEHPFATPHAGWIPAGRLVPGDRVVSARFGAVRVLSVEDARPAEPKLVFNLSVDPSHAYVVGTDQVLVHNTQCKKTLAEEAKELEEAEDTLEDLQLKRLLSPEQKATLEPQIAETKKQVATLKKRIRDAVRRKNAGTEPQPSGPEPEIALDFGARRRAIIGRTERMVAALDSAIRELEGTTGGAPSRLQALKRERARLARNLSLLHVSDKTKRTIAGVGRQRLLREAEADFKSRSEALAAAQREHDELLGEEPRSDAEKKSQAERRAALEKKIEALQLERDVSEEILAGERKIAELAKRSPSTDAERAQIAAERKLLSAMLSKKRQARRNRDSERRTRADDEAWQKRLQSARQARDKRLRTPTYVANKDRPRDTLELLEEELEARRQGPRSESLDEQTGYLAERIATIQSLTEAIRERERIRAELKEVRAKRRELLVAGKDTREVDETIAGLVQERSASKAREVQLRLLERVLAKLDGTTRADAPNAVNEARLRELEQELERDLAEGGGLPEERLREIQHELVEAELIGAELLDETWREAEAEEAALQEAVQDEAEDVDALLRALVESSEKSPSPERTAALESGLQALQNELREERSSIEAADFALANEHAFLSQTLGQPGSSQHAASARRIAEVQQQRIQLRIDWRERMQRRLDTAQRELRDLQSVPRLRDEALEAELARKIALLEHEVKNPAF